jgi:hypothetical protein
MSDKAKVVATLLITAGVHTNRTFLARSFGNMLIELGFDVDMSNVAQDDIEPGMGGIVDKDENFGDPTAPVGRYLMSEHFVGTPIQLDHSAGKPQPLVRPAVPQLLERRDTGIAILGTPNIGKSTLLRMFGDFLKSKEVSDDRISYSMIGEDYFEHWTTEQLMHNLQAIKANTIVRIYTRRSYGSEQYAMIMASTDGYKAPEEAVGE